MQDSECEIELNNETFTNENENVPCFVNTTTSEQYYKLHYPNPASCTGKWCKKVFSDMNVEKKKLNKLCHMIGQSNFFLNHIQKCIICVRHNTSNFINIYNHDPEIASKEADMNSLVFDLKNKIGGYHEKHMVCFSESNFHLGSKINRYTLSLDHSKIDDETESIYTESLN